VLRPPGPRETTFTQATKGIGTLLDSQGLGLMTTTKVQETWSKGKNAETPQEARKNKTEALEQLAKQGQMAQDLTAGYSVNSQVKGLSPQIQTGIEIGKDRNLSPEAREQKLIQAGFKGGVMEFADKLGF
jgi:hypothetical protein